MTGAEQTTLSARSGGWQRFQRWPGVLLLVAGLWSLRYDLGVAELAFTAVGFWATAEFWRGVRVRDGVLVAHGRLSRRRLPLQEVRRVGLSTGRTVWVQPRAGRTLVLPMAERRTDIPGGGVEIAAALHELAGAAGAEPEPWSDELTRPPKPTTTVFGW